jgi:hypothetical protein
LEYKCLGAPKNRGKTPNSRHTKYSRSKNRLFNRVGLVESPQPASNPNHTLKQKSNYQQKVLEDEVAGQNSLLQLI